MSVQLADRLTFARAAALTGKRSIIALRATSGRPVHDQSRTRWRGCHHRALRRRRRRHRIRASHTCAAAASANGPDAWSRSPPRSFRDQLDQEGNPPVTLPSHVDIREVGAARRVPERTRNHRHRRQGSIDQPTRAHRPEAHRSGKFSCGPTSSRSCPTASRCCAASMCPTTFR